MVKFLNHEALASNLFFEGTSVNTSLQAAWIEQCTMTLPALHLLCERMESDWQKLNPKMRKPWSSRELDSELMFGYFSAPQQKHLLQLHFHAACKRYCFHMFKKKGRSNSKTFKDWSIAPPALCPFCFLQNAPAYTLYICHI